MFFLLCEQPCLLSPTGWCFSLSYLHPDTLPTEVVFAALFALLFALRCAFAEDLQGVTPGTHFAVCRPSLSKRAVYFLSLQHILFSWLCSPVCLTCTQGTRCHGILCVPCGFVHLQWLSCVPLLSIVLCSAPPAWAAALKSFRVQADSNTVSVTCLSPSSCGLQKQCTSTPSLCQ